MNIAFCGLRHAHIYTLYELASGRADVNIIGVWEENDPDRCAAQSRITCPFYDSYYQLLADERVDIVAVGDYYGIRGQRVIDALKANKHVLCDKPICTRLEELDEIERLCSEKHLFVGCMLDLRYDPALRLAQKLITDGRLGEIHAINFTGQHPLQYGVRPMWYFESGKHGGTFNDLAVHGLDAIRYITGMEYRRTIKARQYNAFAHQQPDFADCAQLLGEYQNGAGLVADVSYSAPMPSAFSLPTYWRFSFWGEKGMLECRLGEGQVTLACEGMPHAQVIAAEPIDEDCLCDLILTIEGRPTAFLPNDAFIATRAALEIQQAADQTQ